MPTILALDSSTEACSCALSVNGEIAETFELLPRLHTQHILPMIESLMAEHELQFNELDAIAVGAGPGSFTGLRIAAGVAQGIAFGADLPLVPVSTLAAMAHQNLINMGNGLNHILSCLDARINEVYWAVYCAGENGIEQINDEQLCKPESVVLPIELACYGVGNGMAFLAQMPEQTQSLIKGSDNDVYPRAAAMAELALEYFAAGKSMSPEKFSPRYLRNKVTQD